MAGPGIRAWHFASELSRHVPVRLIARLGNIEPAPFTVMQHGSAEAREAIRTADVLIGQPARDFRKRRRGQKVVYDLFDPLVLELRELYGSHPSARQRIHLAAEWWRLMWALRPADLLICG